jgi:tRNA (guanine-N7-)-methyltransferase
MKRTIKSYVLRAGRMTKRQQEGWANSYPKLSLPLDSGVWDFTTLFDRTAPTVLEIGFGMGQSLCQMAKANPDTNYIGIEVHQAGVGALAADIAELQLSNIRLVCHDAVITLESSIADGSLSGVQIFFPDPWHKKKHHKRRLIQDTFVTLLVQKLAPGGFIHCATDWQDYADWILEILQGNSALVNQSETGGFVQRPQQRPLTKFEQRGHRLGHGVWDSIFVKQ